MKDVLSALPTFHIYATEENDAGAVLVRGKLDQCSLTKDGIRWLWLWPSEDEAIIPSIVDLEEASGEVTLAIEPAELRDTIKPAAVLHWLDPYWQAYHVSMILAGKWTRLKYEAADAIHFTLGELTGWAHDEESIPEGAVRTGVEPGGWDHEHCEICESAIGAGGSEIGYVDSDEHWLCSDCYEKWAKPKSLDFLAG